MLVTFWSSIRAAFVSPQATRNSSVRRKSPLSRDPPSPEDSMSIPGTVARGAGPPSAPGLVAIVESGHETRAAFCFTFCDPERAGDRPNHTTSSRTLPDQSSLLANPLTTIAPPAMPSSVPSKSMLTTKIADRMAQHDKILELLHCRKQRITKLRRWCMDSPEHRLIT